MIAPTFSAHGRAMLAATRGLVPISFVLLAVLLAVPAQGQQPGQVTFQGVTKVRLGGVASSRPLASPSYGVPASPDPIEKALQGLLSELQSTGGMGIARTLAPAEEVRLTRGDDGYVRVVGAPPEFHFIVDAANGSSPETLATAFLTGHGDLFGIAGAPFELTAERVNRGAARTYVKLQQTYRGVPVLGAVAIVQVDDAGGVEFATSGLARTPRLPAFDRLGVSPVVAADAAGDLAAAAVGGDHPEALLEHSAAGLVVYDPSLLDNAGPTRLAWRVTVTSNDDTISELVLVDALDGSVLLHFSLIESALVRTVNDANNVVASTGVLARSEGGAATGNPDVDQAYDYCGDTYSFYSSRLGRNSIDNAGHALNAIVRYCNSGTDCPMHNAFWSADTEKIYIGQGLATDDIMAHELTHGVTSFEANLFYWNEPGAINESISDIFGELIDLTNGRGLDSPAYRWAMGEGSALGVIRNMADPTLFLQPDRRWSPLWYKGFSDNRGVHTNSGVGNKLAYLLTDGDTFRGFIIAGLGVDPVADLFHEALSNLLTPTSNYFDLYQALTQAAINLGWSQLRRDNLESACRAVEIATVGGPTTIFTDNFEGPFPGSSWTLYSANNTNWGKSTSRNAGGSASAWCAGGGTSPGAAGGPYLANQDNWMIHGPFSLADAAHAVLTFDYWLQSEPAYDFLGYYVSTDGTNFFGFNASGDNSGGFDSGWIHEIVNLEEVAGVQAVGASQVWIGFRFTSDGSSQHEGAYVDNVAVKKFLCGGPPAAPVVSAPATAPSGQPFTVSWTGTSPIGTYELDEATSPSFAGATTFVVIGASRTLARSDAGSTHYFRARAVNDCGALSPNSATAQTAIGSACSQAAISVQPADKSIQSGQTASLSVTASGAGPLTYQWYQGTSGNTGSPIGGATSSSYTTPALTATTTYWVRVSNSCGPADSRTATVTVATAVPAKFDFGTATSPVAAGFTRVAPTTVFSVAPRLRHVSALSSTGYGWVSGTVEARDRGTGGDLNRDFNFTPLGTFAVTVANGAYDVKMTMGDATGAHDKMGVFLEGSKFDSATTAINQFAVKVFRGVTVADGQLTLLLDDDGGSDANCVINSLELTPATPRKFDFGTTSSPIAGGFVRVANTTTYTVPLGYGWLSGTISSRDRATGGDLNRDFNFTPLGTFQVTLPNGTYNVRITVGDATAAHEQMGILMEGVLKDTLSTAANQFLVKTYSVTISDGQLTVLLDDQGGGDANVVINGLEVL